LAPKDRVTLAAAALSASLLAAGWFLDMGDPTNRDRWRWMLGVALASLIAGGAAMVFGRRQMRPVFRAPLTGLFCGLVAVVLLGVMLAGIEWLVTGQTPLASLRAAALAGLPAGALLGVGIGLIAWAVFRLIPHRPVAAEAGRKRPRFQFGLRTLLFAVLVVALLLWIAMPAQRNYQHQRAVSQLLESGARIEFEKEKSTDWLETLLGGRLDPQWYAEVRRITLGPETTDDDLRLLEQLGEVHDLQVVCPHVTDAGLASLTRLRELRFLYLDCPQATSEGFAALAKLPQLDALHIDDATISDRAVGQLASAANLRRLWLWNVNITGGGLSQLPPVPIQQLIFRGVNVTDADLKHLAALPAIEFLTLSGTAITDAGVANLAGAQTLRHLNLEGAGLTGQGLDALSALPNLQSLSLNSMTIQDADLARLAPLKSLEAVHFRNTLITDAGLPHLEALPALRHVSIYGTWVTKPGADKLRAVLQARKPPGTVYGL
jgi:hypothetical protein